MSTEIFKVNSYIKACATLKQFEQSKYVGWDSVLAQVYKLDSVEELPQMTATERVIRQWFKLSVRLAFEKKKETLNNWDPMVAVQMYR